jgi:hypothetical protein
MNWHQVLVTLGFALSLTACSRSEPPPVETSTAAVSPAELAAPSPDNNAYF